MFFSFVAAVALGQPAPSSAPSRFMPEPVPPGFSCVYERLTPEDRALSQQRVIRRIEATASGDDKALRAKDPTEKDRRKRSIAISGQCQDQFGIPDWQMDDWVAKYTNAINTIDVVQKYVDAADAARIEAAVRSLTPAEVMEVTDKKSKNADTIIIKLMQAVFKTDKLLDKRTLIYSSNYLISLVTIREVSIRWAEWRKAEDEKARAKAAAQGR